MALRLEVSCALFLVLASLAPGTPAAAQGVPLRGARDTNPLLLPVEGPKLSPPLLAPASPDASAKQAAAPLTPPTTLQFEGMSAADSIYLPPATDGAVGPNHYIQVVNVALKIFDKSGGAITPPIATNTLWSGFGGGCESNNDGDARVLYDRQADRWLIAQFSVAPELVCLAVSRTADPTGSYWLYALQTQRFPDSFKLGTWPDAQNNAYFMGTNTGAQGQYDAYALDRENMLLGNPARPAQFFQSYPNFLMPADADGPAPPPDGAPGIFYTFRDGGEAYFGSPANDSLDVYEFHVDWNTPANSTFALVESFTPASGGLVPFNWTVCGFFVHNCLPQPATAVRIDSVSWWPMPRLQYRNFGGRESLLGSWTVDTLNNGNTPGQAAPRWFELRRTTGGWSIQQQGTQAPDAAHRWMSSIAMDGGGDIALGYNVVSFAIFPSIRYATRLPSDTAGALGGEQTMIAGGGSQTHSSGRWGESSSMTVDPVDDCTFWFAGEHVQTTGSLVWRTRIGAFKVATCSAETFLLDVMPPAAPVCGTATFSVVATPRYGFVGSVALSASNTPAGTTAAFGINPLGPGAYSTTLTLSGLDASDVGPNTIEIVADYAGASPVQRRAPASFIVAAPAAPALSAPLDGATNVSLQPTFTWAAEATAGGYAIEIATDSGFGNVIVSTTTAQTDYTPGSPLAGATAYWWRVRALSACGDSAVSNARTFTTASALIFANGFE